jgi:hypothetical protein
MPICRQLGLDFVNLCDKLDSGSAWQHLVSRVFPFEILMRAAMFYVASEGATRCTRSAVAEAMADMGRHVLRGKRVPRAMKFVALGNSVEP